MHGWLRPAGISLAVGIGFVLVFRVTGLGWQVLTALVVALLVFLPLARNEILPVQPPERKNRRNNSTGPDS